MGMWRVGIQAWLVMVERERERWCGDVEGWYTGLACDGGERERERWCGDVEGWCTGLACDGGEREREMVWGCGGLVYRLGL